MIEQLAQFAQPILEIPIVRRTRRNHALEHATIHVLSGRIKSARLAGRSSDSGFVLIGNVPTAEVERAAQEALTRMQKGERRLALHPNCGTNLVTAGALTTFSGWLGLRTTDKPVSLDRLSFTMALMMLAILISQPLGMALQKHFTTKDEPGDLEIESVSAREVQWPFTKAPVTLHQVTTRRG